MPDTSRFQDGGVYLEQASGLPATAVENAIVTYAGTAYIRRSGVWVPLGGSGGGLLAAVNTTQSSPIANTAVAANFDQVVTIPANTLSVGGIVEVSAMIICNGDGPSSGGDVEFDLSVLLGAVTGSNLDNNTVLVAAAGIVNSVVIARSAKFAITAGGGPTTRGTQLVGASYGGVQPATSVGNSIVAAANLNTTIANDVAVNWDWNIADAGNSAIQLSLAVTYTPPPTA